MHLIYFLTIGAIISIVFGEFGQFPFGSTTLSVSITDILIGIIMVLLLIWQVQTKTVPKKIPMILKLLGVFWIIALTSLIASQNFSGITYLLRFVLYSSILYLGYSLIKSKTVDLSLLMKIIFRLGVALSFIGFLQLLYFPDLEPLYRYGYDPHKNRLFSTFLDPNLLGSLLNICLTIGLFLYTKCKSKITVTGIIIILLAIVLTFSRSAYLMLLVETILFFWFYSKKMVLGLILIGLVTMLTIAPIRERIIGALTIDTSAAERIISWQNGLFLISHKPLLGVGFNNLRDAQTNYQLFDVDQKTEIVNSGSGLDSSLVFIAATTGLIGLLSFMTLIGYYQINLIKNIRLVKKNNSELNKITGLTIKEKQLFAVCLLSVIFGILVNSQFIHSLFFTPIMYLNYLLIGIWSAISESKD